MTRALGRSAGALALMLISCKPAPSPGAASTAASSSGPLAAAPSGSGGGEGAGAVEPPSVRRWCGEALRADHLPLGCSPDSDGALTPEQRAACLAEDRVAVIEARFTVSRSASGEDAIGFEIPALKRSLRLTSGALRHPFEVRSFPRLRYGSGRIGGMDWEQVEFCSAERKLLVARLSFMAGRLQKREVEAIELPPGARVRIPSFSFSPAGWRPFGSRCSARCSDAHQACTQGCERSHADGWGAMNDAGRSCSSACDEAQRRCQLPCAAADQAP